MDDIEVKSEVGVEAGLAIGGEAATADVSMGLFVVVADN